MRVRRMRRDTAAGGWRGVSVKDGAIVALNWPVSLLLGAALRRVARRNRDVFDRLGEFRHATFFIAPTELPVAFRLEPDPNTGRVTVVPRTDTTPVAARIWGPLAELLALFDGSQDADAAFFSRSISIEGDTGAVVALHNALEAADLSLADIIGAPEFACGAVNQVAAFGLRAARSHRFAWGA